MLYNTIVGKTLYLANNETQPLSENCHIVILNYYDKSSDHDMLNKTHRVQKR